jgi:hypothetical protein
MYCWSLSLLPHLFETTNDGNVYRQQTCIYETVLAVASYIVNVSLHLHMFFISTSLFQAVCSYYLHPLANSIVMAHMRVVLAMVCTIFFILLSITGVISHLQFHGMLTE